jgi:proteasome lid subunit RPN8/RPN11
MNNIDENILEKIKQYSLSNIKEEVCGFIYINNLKQKFFPSSNISFDRKNSFLINPEDYEKCNFKGNILCCFHSHINNRGFSPEDIRESLKNNLPYLLYNVKQDKFYFFDAIKYKYYEKYIDIPYRNGITDCCSILNYFYENELNI